MSGERRDGGITGPIRPGVPAADSDSDAFTNSPAREHHHAGAERHAQPGAQQHPHVDPRRLADADPQRHPDADAHRRYASTATFVDADLMRCGCSLR